MRAVVQRVSEASIRVDGTVVGAVGAGLMALIGVQTGDTPQDAAYIAEKLAHLRIFEDADGKMNRSLIETGGGALLVSQFTLCGDARRGRRPSFTDAARGEDAERLYEAVCTQVREAGVDVGRGVFGAHMEVALVNDGPVTILLDSRRTF